MVGARQLPLQKYRTGYGGCQKGVSAKYRSRPNPPPRAGWTEAQVRKRKFRNSKKGRLKRPSENKASTKLKPDIRAFRRPFYFDPHTCCGNICSLCGGQAVWQTATPSPAFPPRFGAEPAREEVRCGGGMQRPSESPKQGFQTASCVLRAARFIFCFCPCCRAG